MSKLIPLEFKNQRILTTDQLSEIYESPADNIKVNFNNHKSNFEEGKHYFYLEGEELKEFKRQVNNIYPPIVNKFTSNMYLWTERGANRHCKILDTDKAWDQFDNLEETYFRVKENSQALDTSELSPALQMFNNIFQAVANVELSNKELKGEVQAIKQANNETKEELQGIRDIVAINSADWKDDCKKLVVKIATKLGGFNHIQDVYKEIYSVLEKRLGVQLNARLTNKRRRMADEGVCKSKRDKLNFISVIADDKKLIEGYVAITKELAIKYGI